MARVYRIDGRAVPQAVYLDHVARKAGFANRAEREAYRRSVQRAIKAGQAPPAPPRGAEPYRPLPPGAPGGRGRKAPEGPRGRERDKWHKLGSGGRVKTTGSASVAHSALRGAARRGEEVYLVVKADVTKRYDGKASDRGEAALPGMDAEDLLAAIQAAGGDVQRGIADLLMATGQYDKVDAITEFSVRAYG